LVVCLGVAASADIGARCGLTYSLASGNGAVWFSPSALWAFQAATYYRLSLARQISFQPELGFTMKGVNYHSKWSQELHLNYLEVPVLLGASLIKSVEVLAGPSVAILVNSTPHDSTHDWLHYGGRLRSVDAGLVIGLRCFIQTDWFVEARWSQGLISAVDVPGEPDGRPHKNRSLYLSIGFELGRNKKFLF
jgi:hypothetical protein